MKTCRVRAHASARIRSRAPHELRPKCLTGLLQRGSIRRTAAAAWIDLRRPPTQFAWIQGGARGPQRTERGAQTGRRAQAFHPGGPGDRRVHGEGGHLRLAVRHPLRRRDGLPRAQGRPHGLRLDPDRGARRSRCCKLLGKSDDPREQHRADHRLGRRVDRRRRRRSRCPRFSSSPTAAHGADYFNYGDPHARAVGRRRSACS